MATTTKQDLPVESFETHPDRYTHWKLDIEGDVALLTMDIQEDRPFRPGYELKLNSYDLGVDIELHDAVRRLRFEHPEVRCVVVTGAKDRVFCSGANIHMLGMSSHGFKVNFCKFTNETRVGIEASSHESGQRYLAALNGACAGGGYELALACDEIMLVEDSNSTVSLPEVPLLGVLPGTGGLTRLVDKRMVRRDLADLFCTTAEGVKGKRAKRWNLVDHVVSRSRFEEAYMKRAAELAAASPARATKGVEWTPLQKALEEDRIEYSSVTLTIDRKNRRGTLVVKGPVGDQPETPEAIRAQGADWWPFRAFRELDDALLHLRFNEPEIGLILLRTEGDPAAVLAADKTLQENAGDWFVDEVRMFIARTLRRVDLTARSFYALIEPGSCFSGTLFELALSADRSYMLDDPDNPVEIAVSGMNDGAYLMTHGLSRLNVRFLGEPGKTEEILSAPRAYDPQDAEEAGLVTVVADDIDYEDEVRVAIEERASLSPDSLTGMEASLRFPGPENCDSKIFARLTAWQNWIFQRPNAVGERGALTLYGQPERPSFDYRRT